MTFRDRMIIPFIAVLYLSLLSLGWSALQIIEQQNRDRVEHFLNTEAEKVSFFFMMLADSLIQTEQMSMTIIKETGTLPSFPANSPFTLDLLPVKSVSCPPGSDRFMSLQLWNEAELYSFDLVLYRAIKTPLHGTLEIRRQHLRPASTLLGNALGVDFIIFSRNGDLEAVSMGNEIMPPTRHDTESTTPLKLPDDLRALLQTGTVPGMKRDTRFGGQLVLYVPIIIENDLKAVIGLLYPGQKMDKAMKSFSLLTIMVLSLVTIVLTAIYLVVTHRINRYVANLVDFTQRVSEGDFSQRLPDRGSRDMTTLSTILNGMSESLEKMKQYEQQLIVVDRLSSLVHLSAGIAHEIKNPLMVLGYSARHLKRDLSHETDLEDIDMIEKNIQKIQVVVQKLADFSRPTSVVETRERVDVRSILEEAIYFLRKTFENSGIELHYESQSQSQSQPEPLECMVIKRSVSQVFTNVLLNALEAMPEGGRITISVTIEQVEGLKRFVIFTIDDTGEGIEKENQSRIFNPFFTTKAKGTGLGLAISHQVMIDHGGFITIGERRQSDQDARSQSVSPPVHDDVPLRQGIRVRIGFPLAHPEESGETP